MKKKKKEAIAGYLFILPGSIALLAFSVTPIFMNLYYSFTKYDVFSSPKWVGLHNYIKMTKDPNILISTKNTLIYMIFTVPVQTILALVIAAILAAKYRNKFGNFVKSSMFIPVIPSAIIIGYVFMFLFSTDNGVVNKILEIFGLSRINWFGTPEMALFSVCIVAVWKSVGYFLVIYYAAVMDIPDEYYKAARVDGASGLQQFFFITLPCLRPVTYLVVTVGMLWSMQVFDLVFAMTGGGPSKGTLTLVYCIYNYAFSNYSFGYGSAIAVLLFSVILAVTIAERRLFKEKV